MNALLPDDVLRIILGRFSDLFSMVRFELTFRGAKSLVWDKIEHIDGSMFQSPARRRSLDAYRFFRLRLPELSGSLREFVLKKLPVSSIFFEMETPFPRMHDFVLPGLLPHDHLSTVVNRNIIRRLVITKNRSVIRYCVDNLRHLFSAELPQLEILGLDSCPGITSLFPLIGKHASKLKDLRLYPSPFFEEPYNKLLQHLASLAPALPHLRRIKMCQMLWNYIEPPLRHLNSLVLFPLIRALNQPGAFVSRYCSDLANQNADAGAEAFQNHARLCHPNIYEEPDDRDMTDFAKTMFLHSRDGASDDVLDLYGPLALGALQRYKWFPDGTRVLPPWYHIFLTVCMLNLPDFSLVFVRNEPLGPEEQCIKLLLSKSQRGLNHVLAAGRKDPYFYLEGFTDSVRSFFVWMKTRRVYIDINERIHPALLGNQIEDIILTPGPNELEYADLDDMGYSHVLAYALNYYKLSLPIVQNTRCDFSFPVLHRPTRHHEPTTPSGHPKICHFARINKETPCACQHADYRPRRTPLPLAVHVLRTIDQPGPDNDSLSRFSFQEQELFGSEAYLLLDLLNADENVMEQVQPCGNLAPVLLSNPDLAQRLGYDTSDLSVLWRPKPPLLDLDFSDGLEKYFQPLVLDPRPEDQI